MRKRIKYVAFYSHKTISSEKRVHALSATNKIDYICDSLVKNNYDVEIISPSWTSAEKGIYPGATIQIKNSISLKTFSTFGSKGMTRKAIKCLWALVQLFVYLFVNVEKGEPIIVYHAVSLSLPIRLLCILKGTKVILEVEEIYQDVRDLSSFSKRSEIKSFSCAWGYFFSTELLNDTVNLPNKPHLTIYGSYHVPKVRKKNLHDPKTHIIYAGTFDLRKGGVITAIKSALYLPKDYHVHIIGFGTDTEIGMVVDLIDKLSEHFLCTVTYDGMFDGDDYIRRLQKCSIGLSTQIPEGEYNNTSFPSKILSYMANGLEVVTTRIQVVERSSISEQVWFYDGADPQTVAETIMAVARKPCGDYDSRKVIAELNMNFVKEINELLEKTGYWRLK